jgi:hypothetical protein
VHWKAGRPTTIWLQQSFFNWLDWIFVAFFDLNAQSINARASEMARVMNYEILDCQKVSSFLGLVFDFNFVLWSRGELCL